MNPYDYLDQKNGGPFRLVNILTKIEMNAISTNIPQLAIVTQDNTDDTAAMLRR